MKPIYKALLIFTIIFLSGTAQSQNATVFFSVNMNYQIELGNFNPEDDFVDIAGNFNDWGSTLTTLSDDDQDNIFDITLPGFTVGQFLEYKFRTNGAWNGMEEFPNGGPNRIYTVLSTNDSLFFWYSDEVSPTGPPMASFSAQFTDTQTESQVRYYNSSGGNITDFDWYFEGGTPENSSEEQPVIIYNNPGIFDVRLIVSNESEADSLTMEDYMTVTDRDKAQLAWWNNTVFYEVFARSFYDSDGDGDGDINGLTEKLDYLNDGNPNTNDDLGIQGIWLMPINPSPSYHGYDVTNYKAINPDYGTMEEFKTFLDAAHERGIKVIIDFVMNHSSKDHPWFSESQNSNSDMRDFYRWDDSNPGYTGPWGQDVWHWNSSGYYYGIFWGGMPDLNYEHQAVIDSMFQAADFWLNDVGIDGLRLDAVKYIYEDGPNLEDLPQTIEFWKDFNAFTKDVAPNTFSVGEAWTSTSQVVRYVEDDGLDYCFEFDLSSRLLDAANSGNATYLRDQMSLVYSTYPHLQWGTFLTNHDMNRVMNALNQNDSKHKLAAALYLTLPGIPYIYYGEEIGMLGEKPDENIRRPMQWNNTANGGFTTGTPWNSLNSNYTTYNVEIQSQDPNSILSRYKKMINIRNLKPSLQEGDYLEISANQDAVFSFIRFTPNDTAIVVINTSGSNLSNVNVDLSFTGMSDDTYNMWELMEGELESLNIDPSGLVMLDNMGGYEVKIWSYTTLSSTDQYAERKNISASIFPNPAQSEVAIIVNSNSTKKIKASIFNLQGLEVIRLPEFEPGQSHHFSVISLPKGVYIVRFEGNDTIPSLKLIKN